LSWLFSRLSFHCRCVFRLLIAARNLALAHYLDRMIERGLVADFTAAARMLGVSQPRLTHLMGLLLLAPEIQAAVLLGEMEFGDKELRALTRIAAWSEQLEALARPRQMSHTCRLSRPGLAAAARSIPRSGQTGAGSSRGSA
jgi:hypothetical protein